MHSAVWLLASVAGASAVWVWATRARELVDRISREVCAELDLQRLDESVALRRISLSRTPDGLRVRRVFSFEFSTHGEDRCRGDVCLLGSAAVWVRVEHPRGTIFVDLA